MPNDYLMCTTTRTKQFWPQNTSTSLGVRINRDASGLAQGPGPFHFLSIFCYTRHTPDRRISSAERITKFENGTRLLQLIHSWRNESLIVSIESTVLYSRPYLPLNP